MLSRRQIVNYLSGVLTLFNSSTTGTQVATIAMEKVKLQEAGECHDEVHTANCSRSTISTRSNKNTCLQDTRYS